MSEFRQNTLVVDFSVLPSRPDISAVEDFLMKKIKLKISDVRALQFHNIHHCVYIDMVDKDTPRCYQMKYNCKFVMECNGKPFAIPVYVENGAVTVRIHDLPTSMPATDIVDYMQQYGTVHTIGWERWKHYFPGITNGVRVLRMHLTKPIPSYINIKGEQSLCSYASQHKTCRFCNMSIHPKLKCGEASKEAAGEISHETSMQNEIVNLSAFPPINQQQAITQPQTQQKKKNKPIKRPQPLGYISDTNEEESDNTDTENNTETITGGTKQKKADNKKKPHLEKPGLSSASGDAEMTVATDYSEPAK